MAADYPPLRYQRARFPAGKHDSTHQRSLYFAFVAFNTSSIAGTFAVSTFTASTGAPAFK
jgi:hypothetical protein